MGRASHGNEQTMFKRWVSTDMTTATIKTAIEQHDDLERLRNHAPASIPAIYGDAAFLLWRLLANGRRDLWQAAIRRSAEMHAADLLEAHR